MKRILMVLAMEIGFLGAASAAPVMNTMEASAPAYTAMYVFGDSYSDMGARYLDGNGPTVPVYLARSMGIDLTHSKDPQAGNKSLNFAATAAISGIDSGKGKWGGMGMLDQVKDFETQVRAGKLKFKPETTLFLIEGGLNDSDMSTQQTVDNINAQIKILQSLGARHFTLALLPTSVPDFAENAKRLNPAYVALVADLKMKGVDIYLNKWGAYLDEIHDNPKQYGIVETKAKCAGRALFKEDTTPCAMPESYFYYHSGHPSTAVNKLVADKLYKDLTMTKM